MVAYEFTKSAFLRSKSSRTSKEVGELSNVEAAFCGAVAGSFSAFVTTPLDKMKTMLMTGRCTGGYLDCFKTVIQEEGVGALMQGVAPRVALIGPSVAIFFVVYEKVKQTL